jgi:acetyltransferase-like isoleucine patch superfamily enzyme
VGENSFIGPNAILLHMTPQGEHLPTSVGKNCFIGTGVYVNPGASVGDGIVVGTSGVVTKPIEVPGVYVGVPARLIRPFKVVAIKE